MLAISLQVILFYAPAKKCHLLANSPLPEKLDNDLAGSSERNGVGNQNWHTVCAYKVRKISSLGWQVLKNNERLMDQDTHWPRVRGQHPGHTRAI